MQLAARVAADVKDGWYVNLGVGIPLLVADQISDDKEVMFHSEGGLLGIGPRAAPGEEDPDIINAGKEYVTLRPGAARFDSSMSFAIIRGGHLDLAVMGGLQVNGRGDLANWMIPGAQPGVGGAMDIAASASRLWIIMQHTDRIGSSKLVEECDYPLTAPACVDRVYTNLAIFDFVPGGEPRLVECGPGVDIAEVEQLTEFAL